MARTRHWLTMAGRGNDDGEFGPHKRPLPENLDLLNLARAVESRPILSGMSAGGSREVSFPHDRLSGHEKDDIVRHQ